MIEEVLFQYVSRRMNLQLLVNVSNALCTNVIRIDYSKAAMKTINVIKWILIKR